MCLLWVSAHMAAICLRWAAATPFGEVWAAQFCYTQPTQLTPTQSLRFHLSLHLSYRLFLFIIVTEVVFCFFTPPYCYAVLSTWNLLPIENLPHSPVMNSRSIFAWKLWRVSHNKKSSLVLNEAKQQRKRDLLAGNWKVPLFSIADSSGTHDAIRFRSSSFARLSFPEMRPLSDRLSSCGAKTQDSGQSLWVFILEAPNRAWKRAVFLVALSKVLKVSCDYI